MNTMTAYDKHYLLNRDNLMQTIQMQVSQKEKTFSQFFFFAFSKSILNVKHFLKKDDTHSWCIFVRLFINTLTADDNHYLLKRDNLASPNQMELSQKQKNFSQFLFAFSKSIVNFKHSPKKFHPHSWCISGNTDSEKHG